MPEVSKIPLEIPKDCKNNVSMSNVKSTLLRLNGVFSICEPQETTKPSNFFNCEYCDDLK